MFLNLHTEGTSKEAREHLKTCLKAAWQAIPRDFILSVITSMYDRMAELRKAKGY